MCARWVMTAAHCVEGATSAQVEVLLGTTDLESDEGTRIDASVIV